VGDSLSLWEQQSTYNPNMPLRGLKYFARLYAAHTEKHELNEYGTALLRLPTPRFVVVYVGKDERPPREVLRFSDSYDGAGDIEVKATVINVLAKENDGLLRSCDALKGYVQLVRYVRKNQSSGMPFDAAVDSAVQQCIDEGLLVDYLLQRRSTVVDMFMDEYDEEKIAKLFRRDGFREGREEGLREGLREGTIRAIASLVRDGLLDVAVAAERAGVTEDEIRRAIEARG
jgi:predicted transposase YdaD